MARLIEAEEPVTVLPYASSTAALGWVAHEAPLAPPPGWVLNPSWVADPALTEMEALGRLPDEPIA